MDIWEKEIYETIISWTKKSLYSYPRIFWWILVNLSVSFNRVLANRKFRCLLLIIPKAYRKREERGVVRLEIPCLNCELLWYRVFVSEAIGKGELMKREINFNLKAKAVLHEEWNPWYPIRSVFVFSGMAFWAVHGNRLINII